MTAMYTILETDSLAVVLTKLKNRYRQSYAHIGRVAHLSRNTIKQIADGKTLHPTPETLCRIAVGLAADPHAGTLDQEVLVRTLAVLGRASGYGDLRAAYIRAAVPLLLAVVTFDLDAGAAWLAMAEHQTPATGDEIRGFDALITTTRARRRRSHQSDAPAPPC